MNSPVGQHHTPQRWPVVEEQVEEVVAGACFAVGPVVLVVYRSTAVIAPEVAYGGLEVGGTSRSGEYSLDVMRRILDLPAAGGGWAEGRRRGVEVQGQVEVQTRGE